MGSGPTKWVPSVVQQLAGQLLHRTIQAPWIAAATSTCLLSDDMSKSEHAVPGRRPLISASLALRCWHTCPSTTASKCSTLTLCAAATVVAAGTETYSRACADVLFPACCCRNPADAHKTGVAQEAAKTAGKVAKGISPQEARQILHVDPQASWVDVTKVRSRH
jgi:hypothetical protein